jgi:deoxyribose-phosphate aldolase
MSLEQEFIATLDHINKNRINNKAMYQLAISLIDLTLLDDNATAQELALLQDKACRYQVAAICVYPDALSEIKPDNVAKRATVVNFPHGQDPLEKTLLDIEQIISQHHPDEIDYVFPWEDYLNGMQTVALTHCQQAQSLCKKNKTSFKIILETGAFPTPESIYQLSSELIDTGCDFLKTSTGKIPTGATPLAAFSMLKAIKDSGSSCGIKVSGGIKEPEQAFLYMNLAYNMLKRDLDKTWFRIGASSLLDNLIRYQE